MSYDPTQEEAATVDRLDTRAGESGTGDSAQLRTDPLRGDLPSAEAARTTPPPEQRDWDTRLAPTYSPSLLDAVRESLEQTGIIDRQDSPLESGYLVDADLIDLLDALRGRGWIVQPAPVPGVPVNALPDGPPAPGAPADPGTPIAPAAPYPFAGESPW